jgi:predicted nucleotidyltransferase
MNLIIQNKLNEIAAQHNIKMLYACESGSRGWEFPSPDSDYDVRFIYVRPFETYFSITDQEEHLQFPINDELDIYGWDIRKVLQLVRRSNTTPFEWLQSPIVYMEEPGFRDELWALCQQYFSRRANIHHYLGIAKGALEAANGNEIGIKKLFYVLRPLLSAKWCLEENTISPMRIGPLMKLLPYDIHTVVSELIDQKSTLGEGVPVTIDDRLKAYIQNEMEQVSERSKALEKDNFDVQALDLFFRKTIYRYDDTGAER